VDQDILDALVGARSGPATDVALALADAGSDPVVWAFVAVIGLVVAVRLRAVVPVLAAGVVTVATSSLCIALKQVIERPRPPDEYALVPAFGFSMPSTSSALFAAPCVLLVATLPVSRSVRRAMAVVAVLLNLMIGTAVVYLGVHWASDVLVGWLVAGLVGGATAALVARRVPWPRRQGSGSTSLSRS
jgi:undecaprenyl-diphosphatase